MGSETLPSACYILYDESSIPFYSTSNGYIYVLNIASVFRRVKDYSSIYILDQDH